MTSDSKNEMICINDFNNNKSILFNCTCICL